MAKKRNCRRSEDEKVTHEKAVALRKMTDEQLVAEVENQYEAGYSSGRKAGHAAGYKEGLSAKPPEESGVDRFMVKLANIKGLGTATINKIREALQD